LGLYIFAGRNDHKGLLNLLSQGDLRCFGIVIDAVHVNRHRELREQVVDHRLDAILDPKTQAAATIGGYTEALGSSLGGWTDPTASVTLWGMAVENAWPG
jgi:hypothetical protein